MDFRERLHSYDRKIKQLQETKQADIKHGESYGNARGGFQKEDSVMGWYVVFGVAAFVFGYVLGVLEGPTGGRK